MPTSTKAQKAHQQSESKKEVVAKPAYKQWWFWVAIAAAILWIIGISSAFSRPQTDTSPSRPSSSPSSSTPASSPKEEPTITIIDFSTMSRDEAKTWSEENSVKVIFATSYSSTIEDGGFVEQSPAAGTEMKKSGTVKITYSLGKEPTTGEKNAVKEAKSYLDYSAFSRSGLIKQLEFEGFSTEEATYAVDHVTVDWNEQAAKKAKSYLSFRAFSRSGLISQLEFEGFTAEEAEYGVSQNGY